MYRGFCMQKDVPLVEKRLVYRVVIHRPSRHRPGRPYIDTTNGHA